MNEVTGYNLVNVNINVEVHEYIICNYPGVKHVAAATCPRAHTSFHNVLVSTYITRDTVPASGHLTVLETGKALLGQ